MAPEEAAAMEVDEDQEWCEDEELLGSMYAFTHRPPSALQSPTAVADFVAIWANFIAHLDNARNFCPGLSDANRHYLAEACRFVASAESASFFPKYGCCLLMAPAGMPDIQSAPGSLGLILVGLDKWSFTTHSTDDGAIHHTAESGEGKVVPCGMLASEDREAFLSHVNNVLAKIVTRKGEHRSAAGGKQGHQMTPAMIRAALLQALDQLAAGEGVEVPERQPQGGFTDVGLHTGGIPRDTAWPLVCEAIRVALGRISSCCSSTADLFQQAEAHLRLWLLQRQVQLIDANSATSTALNAAMQMLKAVANAADALAEQGHDVGHFEAACQQSRQALEVARAARVESAASACQLPALHGLNSPCGPDSYRLPRGTLPQLFTPQAEGGNLIQACKRESCNLGSLPMPPKPSGRLSFNKLLAALNSTQQHEGDVAAQHALCMVERELFHCAAQGFVAEAQEAWLTEAEVKCLVQVVDAYLLGLHAFQSSTASQPRMQADLRSRGMLVVWVALCMMHAAANRAHPLLREYGVGVDWKDLRHLVLSDRPAVDAMLATAKYLRQHTKEKSVFTLHDGGQATFELAMQYGKEDGGMKQIWHEEEITAAERQAGHWAEVQLKQKLAASLRARLAQEKEADEAAQRKLKAAQAVRNVHHKHTDDYKSANLAVSQANTLFCSARRKFNLTVAELEAALVSPAPVFQPLPKSASTAVAWLFFLYMPPLLRNLARTTFLAQQQLLPHTAAAMEKVKLSGPKTMLVSHYNNHQGSIYLKAAPARKGSDGSPELVRFLSDELMPETDKVKLASVEHYTSPDQGIWHPDSLPLRMGWQGSNSDADGKLKGCGWFNPWAAMPQAVVVEAFTEMLPKDAAGLQWAMPIYGGNSVTESTRGNLAIARQDQRPLHMLSKPGYLALCTLRAYPLTQYRQLCAALHQRILPLQEPAVQTVMRQALYHCGELTDDGTPALFWRTDWKVPGGVLETLAAELADLADELKDSPRQYGGVLLLGEMAAYLSAWHPRLRDVARQFANAAVRWADDLEDEASTAPPDAARPVRAKQCVLRTTALLCHASGELRTADVQQLLSLAVLVHHGSIYGNGTALEESIEQLQVLCHWALARRLDAVLSKVEVEPAVLTAALRGVLQDAPKQLEWIQRQRPATTNCPYLPIASFRAFADAGLYSINCLDGTVLLNGSPPGRLPREILDHPLFKRSFGTWGFEVALSAEGVHRTIAPVRGRFYEFWLVPDSDNGCGELMVLEKDKATKRCLQLLDPGADEDGGSWGSELPVRLLELHSHWLCREEGVLVLRPHHFREHQAAFILECRVKGQRKRSWDGATKIDASSSSRAADVEFVALRVPADVSKQHAWPELLRSHRHLMTDQLVLHSSPVAQVLSKLEELRYIHVYIPASNGSIASHSNKKHGGYSSPPWQMLFDLPRFRLQFELRDGRLLSREHASHELAPCQQLWEPASRGFLLPDFKQYLVLQARQQGSIVSTVAVPPTLVVVPVGDVERQTDQVYVLHSDASGDTIQVHRYEIHPRFGNLRASSIHARLQLAALFAATGSLLPDPGSRMTGAQQAMALLRQCWGTQPLSEDELRQLQSVARLGGHMAAGLRLLAYELQCSAAQLNSLHYPPPAEVPEHCQPPTLNPDWAAAYEVEQQQHGRHNHRLLLTLAEEQRALCHISAPVDIPLWRRRQLYQPIDVPACSVAADAVKVEEAALRRLVAMPSSNPTISKYPPRIGGSKSTNEGTPLERHMHEELQDSWEEHHKHPEPTEVEDGCRERIVQAKARVEYMGMQAEKYLSCHLASVPKEVGVPSVGFRMRQASGCAPQHGPLDLLSLALPSGTQLARQLNPFLSDTSIVRLREGARIWLQLCVLEDRLGRLERLSADPSATLHLIQELLVHRQWRVEDHPKWLVFEAEQQLQIRPVQYWVPLHLMSNLGHTLQLNMGEGKTRVILPMLILHWADGDSLVRLNLLRQLLDEAYSHLHGCLCASALGLKLFLQPFHRDVQLTAASLAAMRSSLTYCQQAGGVLLTTPERRLSLLLKWHELWQKGQSELCSGLDGLAKMPYLDVLDESDELLSHAYQLIYAVGAQTELPSQQARATAGQALLHSVSHAMRNGGPLGTLLLEEGVAVASGPVGKPGAFRGVRLLPVAALERAAPELSRLLAQALLAKPPYAMRWLKLYTEQDELLRCIIDQSMDAIAAMDALSKPLIDTERADVLALRGLLGCGVLQHCLQMRHLVDYGVNDHVGAKKRLAVPYRAAHVPSERSEYAQPDSALTLATLAYYHRGLTRKELLEALAKLLRLGQNAQQAHYAEWLALALADITAEELASGNQASKLDTTNAAQVDLLHSLFSHNMAAVDFWLNSCVFPEETRQFPSRLVATSWNLADCKGRVVGFSGTNDNHRLLPKLVQQHLDVESSLRATNGKMLAVLLANPWYHTIVPEQNGADWEALLHLAVREKMDAIVDCGALLAGTSNRAAAEYLLPRLDRDRFKGVCYFDEERKEWVVADPLGRRQPRASSPIREAQCLTLFDEARCRGADLQLRLDAVGLLTLGPATTKDKLMQSAGRLRKLGKGQTLQTVGTADVTAKIASKAGAAAHAISSLHVLQWAMDNTVAATQRGVVEWAHQGLLFAATKDAPKHALQPEVLDLAAMYGAARDLRNVPVIVEEQYRRRLEQPGLPADMLNLMQQVVTVSKKHGKGHQVVAQGGLDEQCERVLEREEEEEEEVERQLERVEAAAEQEQDWDYAKALGATANDLQARIGLRLMPLSKLAAKVQPAAVGHLPWSPLVLCTPNFAATVQQSEGEALNEYLRPVGHLLLCPNLDDNKQGGIAVMLSEREANGLLEAMWAGCGSNQAGKGGPLLVSLCYAYDALEQPPRLAADGGQRQHAGQTAAALPHASAFQAQLVSLQLWDGEATFATVEEGPQGSQQLRLLRELVAGRGAEAQALVAMRGKQVLFSRSQLELACDPKVPQLMIRQVMQHAPNV